MTTLNAIILGTIQGFGEFLPISSSGHLVLIPWLLKFKDPGLAFDVMLHLGTTLSLIAYFWEDFYNLILGFLRSIFLRRIKDDLYARLAWLIIIATIPAGIVGFMMDDIIETTFRNPLWISFFLISIALYLWFTDKSAKKNKELSAMSVNIAIIIGLYQCLALIPGVSRSAITIIAALICGFNRESSARFSFLISMPIILGAGLLKIPDIINNGLDVYTLGNLIIGFSISAITGYIAIKFLLSFVKKHSLNIFVYYRIILGLLIFALYYLRNSV
ncbi:MAG: undecaprenyl-diphosphatase UppP [Elusimicrobiota bacterium]